MAGKIPIAKTYKLFIDGAFPRSESGRTFSVNNSEGELIANVSQASRKDFREAVRAARSAQSPWASRTAYNRGQILYRVAEMLESLPGVGHKTASVIMAQVFNIPSFPVDTHIHRLSQRWGLTKGDNVIQTEKDLKRIFPSTEWNKLHLQIIFYGREYCTARGCDGTKCYICRTLYPKRKSKFICKKP